MRTLYFLLSLLPFVHSFVSPARNNVSVNQHAFHREIKREHEYLAVIRSQRKSVASIQTMGLFGLGGFEIAIILVAGAFVLGPEKLGEISRGAGKMSSELTDIPKEFQKGLEEGEAEARSRKAKPMQSLKEEE